MKVFPGLDLKNHLCIFGFSKVLFRRLFVTFHVCERLVTNRLRHDMAFDYCLLCSECFVLHCTSLLHSDDSATRTEFSTNSAFILSSKCEKTVLFKMLNVVINTFVRSAIVYYFGILLCAIFTLTLKHC